MRELEQVVRRHAGQVLGLSDPGTIDLEATIESFGLDSLMALDLRARLSRAVNRRLPTDFIYDLPTLGALVAELARRLEIPSRPSLADALKDATDREREALIYTPLHDLVARTLGRDQVPEDKSLREMGIDDVMGAELCLTIQRLVGVRVSPRETLDCRNLDDLVQRVASFCRPYRRREPRQELAQLDASITSPYDSSFPDYGHGAAATASDQTLLFVLSPPRSGSTLLRVMLAGHSRLFSPQELHLAPFADMRRYDHHLRGTVLNMGLISTIAEVRSRTGSWTLYRQWVRDAADTASIYRFLADNIGDRTLVDKSPLFFPPASALQRLSSLFRARPVCASDPTPRIGHRVVCTRTFSSPARTDQGHRSLRCGRVGMDPLPPGHPRLSEPESRTRDTGVLRRPRRPARTDHAPSVPPNSDSTSNPRCSTPIPAIACSPADSRSATRTS